MILLSECFKVSIPQAVGTIAIFDIRDAEAIAVREVSIPQAVGTIAIEKSVRTEQVTTVVRFQYRKR